LLAYTHYFGLLLLAAHFLYAVGFRLWRGFCDKTSTSDRWSTLAHVFFVFFIIQLLWLPWTPEFLGHRERVANSFWTREFAWDQLGGVCCQLFALTWPGGVPSHSFIWGVGLSYLVFTIALIVFGRHGVRLIGVAVFVTFAGAIGSSLLARNIMSARYFVFAHALLVCGIAIAAAGIHLRLPRNTILVTITAVASWLSWIHIKYRDEVAKRPGMAAAMGYLAEARKSDEPVVVANPMLQIAAVAEAVKPVKVKVLSPTAAFPFFQGTAVMQDDDYLSPAELIGSCVNRFWAIDAVNWTHGTFTVEIPDPWVDVSKEVFPGQLSTASQIIVRCYQRRSAKRESSHVH
jgi:hypothetical protein